MTDKRPRTPEPDAPRRPPHPRFDGWSDTTRLDGCERRVCPNCRNYFDIGEGSDRVFCSDACRTRHEHGVYL